MEQNIRFEHINTGGIYELIGSGLFESTEEPMVIYRSIADGAVWIRPKTEFFDGRFQTV